MNNSVDGHVAHGQEGLEAEREMTQPQQEDKLEKHTHGAPRSCGQKSHIEAPESHKDEEGEPKDFQGNHCKDSPNLAKDINLKMQGVEDKQDNAKEVHTKHHSRTRHRSRTLRQWDRGPLICRANKPPGIVAAGGCDVPCCEHRGQRGPRTPSRGKRRDAWGAQWLSVCL